MQGTGERDQQLMPDGPGIMTEVPIKRRGLQPTIGTPVPGGWHVGRHHQTAAASLLTLSLLGLMTSVLAASAAVLVSRSVDVVLRLPISANLGTLLVFFRPGHGSPSAANVVVVVLLVVSTKAFSFHNRSSPNFAHKLVTTLSTIAPCHIFHLSPS